jgi:hypothetical protein
MKINGRRSKITREKDANHPKRDGFLSQEDENSPKKKREKICLKKDENYHDIGKIPGYTWRRDRRLQHISP